MNNYEVMEDIDDVNVEKQEVDVLIPSTACIWVMLFYISMGTIMFAEWEQWDYLDSAYFCVTSLLKVLKNMIFYMINPSVAKFSLDIESI